jgi:hypothetical protein
MNTDLLDKKIIIIDSSKCIFNNNNFDFYFDIKTPIRDVLFIKIISSTIILNNLYSGSNTINGNTINDQDTIFIRMNDYKRLLVNTDNTTNDSIYDYFDSITIDKFKYLQEYIANNGNLSLTYNFTNFYSNTNDSNDPSIYVLNPIEPSLKRFNIQLYDNNNIIIGSSDNISKVLIKICVYTIRRKVTMI